MLPLVLTAEQGAHALSALRHIASADGPMSAPEKELLDVHAKAFACSLESLPPHDADALLHALPDPAHRAALVQRLVIMALIDGALHDQEVESTRRLASTLGVFQPAVRQMELFRKGRIRALSFDLMRRSFLFGELRRVYRRDGLRGVLKTGRQARGVPDPELAARYQELEHRGEGSLGRTLFLHFRASGFAMPGEAGGSPETLLFHDLGHALTGFETHPEGEVQMAGFEAGYMGRDGFGITVIALYLFHLGADVNPTAKPTQGRFALAPFRDAFALGARCRQDLREWDPWPHMDRPLADVRTELHLA